MQRPSDAAESGNIMKKSTKGAAAAGTAAVLLLGGAGSLAYWTDSSTISGTDINSGQMSLADDDCGGWKLDDGSALTADTKLVPGDSVSNVCTYTIHAVGDHLSATLSTPAAVAATGALAEAPGASLPVSAAYDLEGTSLTSSSSTITSADDGKKLTATISVDFEYGTPDSSATDGTNGNATQDKAASLSDIAVTLTQDPHATPTAAATS